MSTKDSPLWKLKAEADRMASILKAAEAGKPHPRDPAGKLAAFRGQETITVGVFMDDKLLQIKMAWATIRDTSEAGISEFIVNAMREARTTVQ